MKRTLLNILLLLISLHLYSQEVRMVVSLAEGAADGIDEDAKILGTIDDLIIIQNKDDILVSNGLAEGTKNIGTIGDNGFIFPNSIILNNKIYCVISNDTTKALIEIDPIAENIRSIIQDYESIGIPVLYKDKLFLEVEPTSFETSYVSIDPLDDKIETVFKVNSFGGVRAAVVHKGMLYTIHWSDSKDGAYLSRTDGTSGNVEEFAFLHDGSDFSRFSYINMTSTEGNLFFFYYSEDSAYSFYTSDGTKDGTIVLQEDMKPISFFDYDARRAIASIDNKILFRGQLEESQFDKDLWVSDGTPEGTYTIRVADEDTAVEPEYFTAYDDKLYFYGNNRTGWLPRKGMIVTDGTIDGTYAPYDDFEHEDELYYTAYHLNKHDGKLFFAAESDKYGSELYSSVGDLSSITRLSEIAEGDQKSSISSIYSAGKNLFFIVDTNEEGRELYVYGPEITDVDEVTSISVDIYPNPASDYISIPKKIRNTLHGITIVSMTGEIVQSFTKPNTSLVNVQNLSSGHYVILFNTSKGDYTSKFIKE